MKTILTLNLPLEVESALRVSGYTPERLEAESRHSLAATLFAGKVLSLGQAALLDWRK